MLRPKRMTRFVVLLKISIVLFGFLFLTQHYLKSFAYQQQDKIIEVWKSTTEIPKSSIVLQNVLYFNRIPKTGSENFVFLMSKLSTVRLWSTGCPNKFWMEFFFKNFKFVKLEFWYFLSKKNRQIEKADYNKQTFTNFSAFVILTDFLLYIQNLLEHPVCTSKMFEIC